jgi:hypothetical protein
VFDGGALLVVGRAVPLEARAPIGHPRERPLAALVRAPDALRKRPWRPHGRGKGAVPGPPPAKHILADIAAHAPLLELRGRQGARINQSSLHAVRFDLLRALPLQTRCSSLSEHLEKLLRAPTQILPPFSPSDFVRARFLRFRIFCAEGNLPPAISRIAFFETRMGPSAPRRPSGAAFLPSASL